MPPGSTRICVDPSVFGGVFDAEFERPSRVFFDQVRAGRFQLVISRLVEEEVSKAPEGVQGLFAELLELLDVAAPVDEAVLLQGAYLQAGILGQGSMADALHVAMATVSGCRAVVSRNFRHIVNMEKIPRYNGVDMARGYAPIGIHSPLEVIGDAED